MNDRELLELAAKAAGYMYVEESIRHPDGLMMINFARWNPLTDDGDAFRLAVKLDLVVNIYDSEVVGAYSVEMMEGADKCAATRRAIVRAAAEVGRAMP